LPAPQAPQTNNPVSLATPSAKRVSAAISSRLRPGRKFENRGGSGGASSKTSCSKSAIQVGRQVRRSQVAQADQQGGAHRQGEQYAGESEEFSEGEERENHRQRM